MKKYTLIFLLTFWACSQIIAQESETLWVKVEINLRIVDGEVDTLNIKQDTLFSSNTDFPDVIDNNEEQVGQMEEIEVEEVVYEPNQKELDRLRILELDPNDEVDILEIQYLQLKVDSATHLENVAAYKTRIDTLGRLYKETQKAYKIAKAYFASKEKLNRIVEINYGTRRSIGYSNNKIDLIREQNGRDAKSNSANLSLSDVYDENTGKFKDLDFIDVDRNLSLRYKLDFKNTMRIEGGWRRDFVKLVNGGFDLSDNTQMYFNAAYVYKKVNSFANYRTPYWRTVTDFPYLADFFPNGENGEYIGYVPTFDGDLNDYNGTIGVRNETNGWITDASFTVGGNRQTYYVTNTHNRSDVLNADGATFKYQQNSPLAFDVGGTQFTHAVGNIDITRRLSDMIGIAFGSEFRSETFEVIAGSESSYEGGGPDSFAGNDPRNSGKFNRYNFGGYFDVALDLTDDFLINGTARLENYSDFGSAFVWKVSTRYKLADDKVTLRGSASTGFRAPLLHQIYTQKAQYSFVPGSGIQVGGLINNVSREARLLGLPSLDAEKSTNITVGVGTRVNDNLSITLDYYNIAVEDRIILSTEIGASDAGNTALDDILSDNNLSDLSFFVNAMDTRTSGIDIVANYRGIDLGSGKMNVNLSGNYTISNEREGDIKNPKLVSDAGQTVSNATQEALFFTSRPLFKAILGLDFKFDKFGASLNNTLFGPTTFRQQGLDEGLYTEFATKVVTDLAVTYQAAERVTLALNVNNIFNVLPEWSFKADAGSQAATDLSNDSDGSYAKNQSNLITFNQRYSQMTYDGYHFSQLGTILNFSVTIGF